MMVKFLRRFKYYISVKIVKIDCLYPYLIVSVLRWMILGQILL